MSYNLFWLMFCAQRGAKYKPDYETIDAARLADALGLMSVDIPPDDKTKDEQQHGTS